MKSVPTEVKLTFLGTNHRGSPDVQFTDKSSLASWAYAQMGAGQVGSEYIGEHGVAGLLYPPLEYYDARHEYLLTQPVFIEATESWRERALAGDDEQDADMLEAESSEPEEEDDEPVQGEHTMIGRASHGSEPEDMSGDDDPPLIDEDFERENAIAESTSASARARSEIFAASTQEQVIEAVANANPAAMKEVLLATPTAKNIEAAMKTLDAEAQKLEGEAEALEQQADRVSEEGHIAAAQDEGAAWLSVGVRVQYQSAQGKLEPAVVRGMHTDDPVGHYYTIVMAATGAERQTSADRLRPDQVEGGTTDDDVEFVSATRTLLPSTWTHETSGSVVEDVQPGDLLEDDCFGHVEFIGMTVTGARVRCASPSGTVNEVFRTLGHLRRRRPPPVDQPADDAVDPPTDNDDPTAMTDDQTMESAGSTTGTLFKAMRFDGSVE